jgi:nucleotide-binding universal stress UspA family protein
LEAHKDPVEALLEASTEAKMLVVGSRGRGGFRRLLLGSTAHGVLTHLPCPTVITRVQRMKHLA